MSPRRFPGARVTLPPSASSWPVRMRKRVVFPAPFFPRMPTRSPVSTWKVSPSSTGWPTWYSFCKSFTAMSIIIYPLSGRWPGE